jgi:hypothetical protein
MPSMSVPAIVIALLGLLFLIAPGSAAAMDSGTGDPAVVARDHDEARSHDLARLRGLSPVVGIVLIAIAAIPLLAGWRFLRLALGLLVGGFAALWTWQYGMAVVGGLSADPDTVRLLHLFATMAMFVAGFVLGWVLYQVQLALAGALLGAMVLSLPGIYLDWPLLTLGLMLVGAAVGFIVGWVAAPYWAALQTAILGAFLVLQGTAILCQQGSDETMRTVAYAAAVSTGVFGFICQCWWIARHRAAPPPTA